MLGCCLLCRAAFIQSPFMCPDCLQLLERLSSLNSDLAEYSQNWQRFCCLGSYQGPLMKMISKAKFGHDLTMLNALALMFSAMLKNKGFDSDTVLIPVPMAKERLYQRGFNQSVVLAKTISGALNLSIDTDLISNRCKAKTQHQLSRKQRMDNMKGAFQCHKAAPPKVAIIDDIYTTGATIHAMCRSLKRFGCEYIEIWIIAKTL